MQTQTAISLYVGICKKCGYLVYDGDLKFSDNTVQVIGSDVNNFKDKLQSHLEHSHHAPQSLASELCLNDYRFIPKQPLTDFAVFNIVRMTNQNEISGFLASVKRDELKKGRGKWTVRNTQVPKNCVIPV